MPEGRQSPPPETQSGKQLHDPTANAQGVESSDNKDQTNSDQLKNLTSNPTGVLDQHAEDVVSKKTESS